MKQTMILILQDIRGEWVLRIATGLGTDQELVTRYTFKRLIEAYEAACLLQLHVDNEHLLPLRQYAKGA